MADHRAEQITNAFTTTLTGLTSTGANVIRDRIFTFDTSLLPALSIYQGDDTPLPYEYRNFSLDDFLLTIHVDIYAQGTTAIPVSQTLNQVRKEIIIAIQADYTLGLSFVIDTEEGTAFRPLIEHIDKVNAVQTMDFNIKYRRSRTDPSTS